VRKVAFCFIPTPRTSGAPSAGFKADCRMSRLPWPPLYHVPEGAGHLLRLSSVRQAILLDGSIAKSEHSPSSAWFKDSISQCAASKKSTRECDRTRSPPYPTLQIRRRHSCPPRGRLRNRDCPFPEAKLAVEGHGRHGG
jgi:hypothetical protein